MIVHEDMHPHLEHIRCYNDHTASEVVAIIPSAVDGNEGRRDIVLRRRGELSSSANELIDAVSAINRLYDPLSYVPLFPFLKDRWLIQLITAIQHSRIVFFLIELQKDHADRVSMLPSFHKFK